MEMTREEAIEILTRYREESEEDYYVKRAKALTMAIKALKQEPKKGHWIMTGDYYTGAYGDIDYVKCSCCHNDSLEEGAFCPNCGAKMESE